MSSTAHTVFTGHVRPAFSLAELLTVLSIAGILLALVVSRFSARGDRLAVRGAIGDAEAVFAEGRELALAHRAEVAVVVDTAYGDIRVMERGARLLARRLRVVYGVRLMTTRDSMVYDARGLGRGVANLRVVAVRRLASDTLFVSRLGRVRRAGSGP